MADIQPPDLETKMAILDKKAELEGVALPEDVRTFMATKTKSNVRELEGALVKLIAYSSLTGSAITCTMAQQVLKSPGPCPGPQSHHRFHSERRRRALRHPPKPTEGKEQHQENRGAPASGYVPGQGADAGLSTGDRPRFRRQASHHRAAFRQENRQAAPHRSGIEQDHPRPNRFTTMILPVFSTGPPENRLWTLCKNRPQNRFCTAPRRKSSGRQWPKLL